MKKATIGPICAAALIFSSVLCTANLARAQQVATLTFSGHITEVVSTPPYPFDQTSVGDPWTCTYTFDLNTQDVDGSPDAGQYQNAITSMVLTIGTPQVSGTPGPRRLPSQLDSAIFVNLTGQYADYGAQMGLPVEKAWVQITLVDGQGTPFVSDALPKEIPEPLSRSFPDLREFTLNQVGTTQVILRGELGPDAPAVGTITQLRTDLLLTDLPGGYKTVDLLVDSVAFGPGGVAGGEFLCPGCERMGVEPSPFRWVAVDPETDFPPDGTVAISFSLDTSGEVMGVEPSPFHIFVEVGGEIVGELDFYNIGGVYPGTLGSLDLEGLSLIQPSGNLAEVQSFEAFDGLDEIAIPDTQANFRVSTGIEHDTIDLVVDSQLYGDGGMGSGLLLCAGCERMGVEPSPFRWVIDPITDPVPDGTVAISFSLDTSGEVMGVEPSPFRIVAATETAILGDLDFSQVSGYLGSLNLQGVRIALEDGSFVPVGGIASLGNRVQIDIKPGSDDNTVNLGSSGAIPVAILSSEVFDATTVNPDTVSLAGASVKLKGKGDRYLAHIDDANGDGLADLKCQVLTEQLLIEPGASEAVLEANTYDGFFVSGTDALRIVSD